MPAPHFFNGPYSGCYLEHISFPIGGLGAGMFALEGNGGFSHFSLRHRADLFNNPAVYSAIAVRRPGQEAWSRVIESPVPAWKFTFPWDRGWESSGHGARHHGFGLPRFQSGVFTARFPFATVALESDDAPLGVSLTGWSPFIPGDADASGLPVGAVEYTFHNRTAAPLEAVYSFHAANFFQPAEGRFIAGARNGFVLDHSGSEEKLAEQAALAAWVDDPGAVADLAWFRGGWFDAETLVWKHIADADAIEQPAHADGKPGGGASLYLPLTIQPGEQKTVRLLLAWHVPFSTEQHGGKVEQAARREDFFRPWYASRFADIHAVATYWTENVDALRARTQAFTDCFQDSTLPPEVLEAVAANLTILKSPTVMRQHDGRLWAWEGCQDEGGSCHGSCTHVWNYAQALPHLFPTLERTLRETEFNENQDARGHQNFRAWLPIRPADHGFHAAADGQLGGIIKAYRDWRISGDTAWLANLWPRIRQSLDYCIETWDPEHGGLLVEPHHNTYDIEFWGADGMCTSFYLAALQAAIAMGRALGEPVDADEKLLALGKARMEAELFNGEYFIQKVQWQGLRSPDPTQVAGLHNDYTPEARALLDREGPKYQYGAGCLSDGILGEWMGWSAGLEPVIEEKKIASHLQAVHRHNLRRDLSTFANTQRPSYAFGREGGLLLCTWPRGKALTLPFVYSNEVWTGIEYQAAAHLIALGRVAEGLEIVRVARARYDGLVRNPVDEYECGHWYARALSSYSLLQALSGARYDAVERTLYLLPRVTGDFRSFLATASGFGSVGVRDGQPYLEVKSGSIDVQRIEYSPAGP